jgi:tetratricopeptide (TPR) repeat protein
VVKRLFEARGPRIGRGALAGALAACLAGLACPRNAVAEGAARPSAAGEAPARPSVAAPRPPGADSIQQTWLEPADSLAQRAQRTRRASLEAGVWSLDPAARALLASGTGSLEERSEAAVHLAPDLPAARMARAEALWRRGDAPFAALREVLAAFSAFSRNPEAGLWLAASGLALVGLGLVAGGLVCAASAGAIAAPHAAHDLGDALGGDAPAFARMALVASLVGVPGLLGEGVLGLALGILALGALYGTRRERVALAAAATAIWLGLYPVAETAGRCLEALARDPVAAAAIATDRGSPSAVELGRLRAAAERGAASRDPLAERVIAKLARRHGRLGEADGRYQELVDAPDADAALVNDAANVRLRLGHLDSALALYRRSIDTGAKAAVLFNLSQANARSFEVEALTRSLQQAQALDADLVAELTSVQGVSSAGDFVVDLPVPARLLWQRLARATDGRAFAAEVRQPLAPGRLGAEPRLAVLALAAPVLLGSLAGARFRHSRWCSRCGRRNCPRCDGAQRDAETCGACHRLFFQPDQTQRELRVARVAALEERRRRLDRTAAVAAVLVPGAAGLAVGRPLRALGACVAFAIALGALVWRDGIVPDPQVAGAAGPAALLGLAVAAGCSYLMLVASSLAARRSD